MSKEVAMERLKELYDIVDQSQYHIMEKMNEFSRLYYYDLDEIEVTLFNTRYQWIVGFLKHYRLGDDCLNLIKETEIYIGDDTDQEVKVEEIAKRVAKKMEAVNKRRKEWNKL